MPARIVPWMMLLPLAIGACSRPTADSAAPAPAAAATAAAGDAAAPGDTPSVARVGERIYNGNCVPSHQQNGAGIRGVYPGMGGSPVVNGDPAALALWVIKGQRPASMPAGRYSTQMMLFGWMKPADAAALFTYLRSNFGNAAPPVDAAAVARALGQ